MKASAALLERVFDVPRTRDRTVPAMAGLRGLAVFFVFLTHYASQIEASLDRSGSTARLVDGFAAVGHTGVDLFFVLSGYLIYGGLILTSQPVSTFLLRRARRIYPAFLCVLALYIALALAFPQERKLPTGSTDILVYVAQNVLLLPGIFDITPIITVAWSLSYEAFFYLLAPAVVIGCGLRQRPARLRITAIAILTVAGFVLASYAAPTHLRLLMFPAGMLLFEARRVDVGKSLRPYGLVALGVILVAIPLLDAVYPESAWQLVILFAGYAALCHDALHCQTLTSRLFSWAPLRWLGNMSYSYYLIHGLTLKAIFLLVQRLEWPISDERMSWGLLPIAGIATLIPSTTLFLIVEKRYSFPKRSSYSAPPTSQLALAGFSGDSDPRLLP